MGGDPRDRSFRLNPEVFPHDFASDKEVCAQCGMTREMVDRIQSGCRRRPVAGEFHPIVTENPRLVEFETDPERNWVDGRMQAVWTSKITVHLDWVAAARPHGAFETVIALAGAGRFDATLNIPYPEFMKLWKGVAGLPT